MPVRRTSKQSQQKRSTAGDRAEKQGTILQHARTLQSGQRKLSAAAHRSDNGSFMALLVCAVELLYWAPCSAALLL